MYSVLVVDDDATCLAIAKGCLRRWNYEVMAVSHALEALCILRARPYDLVLTDVHMPQMNGLELQRRINKEFDLPVILISGDDKKEVVQEGLKNGAMSFLLKPIIADDVKNIYLFCILWKNRNKSTLSRTILPRNICSSSTTDDTGDKQPSTERTRKIVWTPALHNRFVEVLLILGYHDAVPRIILEVMNVQAVLSREQVASHLQKYRKFVNRVLDGKTSLEYSKYWMNCNYFSSIVGGNPNLILINQLREERRTGKEPSPIPASLPLPPVNEAEASSCMSWNAMLMPNNYASSCVNVAATQGLGSATFLNAGNLNMESIVGSNTTYNNPIPNVNNEANQIGYYNQNTVDPQQNYYFTDGGLINGGANNNMFPSTNHIGLSSSTAPIHNNIIYEKPFNVGGQGSTINLFNGNNFNGVQLGNVQGPDPNIGTLIAANQFGNTVGMNEQFGNVQPDPNIGSSFGANLFGNALTMNEQLGNVQPDPNIGSSFGENQFGNALTMNEQQLGDGGVQMADGSCLINNNGVNNIPPAANSSLLSFDPNLMQGGENWDNYQWNMRNLYDDDSEDELGDDVN